MNTMKFVVVLLFSLIGSASAAVSQADCATLSAYMRCRYYVGSAEADCDTSICKWSVEFLRPKRCNHDRNAEPWGSRITMGYP